MGISKRVNSANKIEIRELKAKIKRMAGWNKDYPGQLSPSRRMDFTISMNEMSERIDYLRKNKTGSEAFEFTYVLTKKRTKNRKA